MDSLPLLTSLLLLLLFALFLGRVASRFRQPPIVGEMLSGILLGPAMLDWIGPDPRLTGISELAVFLIVLSAGLEMDFADVLDGIRGRSAMLGALGFVVPFLSGLTVGAIYGLDFTRTVFLGLCISITALPVAVRILESFGALDTAVARYSIATAILNDVAALLVLGVLLNLPDGRSARDLVASVAYSGGRLVLLAALILGVNLLIERAQRRGLRLYLIPERLTSVLGVEALLGAVAIFVLLFASTSELLGFHFVIGAFFGALLLGRRLFSPAQYAGLKKTLGSVTGGFLAPVFFASMGLEFDLVSIESFGFVLVVILVSVASKIMAGRIGGWFIGLSRSDSWSLGVILNGRGVMELVIANIAYQRGFIEAGMFSTLVLMGVVTTLLTPILFQRTFDRAAAG